MEIDANMSGLVKFKAEDFEVDEDYFHKLLSQKTGTTKSELRYVIRDRVVLELFPDVATEQMYQICIYGKVFGEDNRQFFGFSKSI